MNAKTIKMEKGEMTVMDYGAVRVHAYRTHDPIDDEVFVLQKGNRAVIIEMPCFRDNIAELSAYLKGLHVTVDGKLVAYHAAGASFLPDVRTYGTASSEQYNRTGQGFGLIQHFAQIFGPGFDAGITHNDVTIAAGPLELAGIRLNIIPNQDAYEIEIPEIKAAYIHMLGHDCHSIVAGAGHAQAIIADLQGYIDRGFATLLSAHYVPEDQQDVRTKIAYLRELTVLAGQSRDAAAFKTAVQQKYPAYAGGNYLDMTVGFFFPQ